MGIRFGPIDPLQLIFEILNDLMKKGILSYEDAREIIKKSLAPDIPDKEKDKILDDLIKKK